MPKALKSLWRYHFVTDEILGSSHICHRLIPDSVGTRRAVSAKQQTQLLDLMQSTSYEHLLAMYLLGRAVVIHGNAMFTAANVKYLAVWKLCCNFALAGSEQFTRAASRLQT